MVCIHLKSILKCINNNYDVKLLPLFFPSLKAGYEIHLAFCYTKYGPVTKM